LLRFRIVVLPGDGIGTIHPIINLVNSLTSLLTGPEVVTEAAKVLKAVSDASSDFDLKLESHDFGGCAIEATGEPLPDSTLKACQEADAILMGTCRGVRLQYIA
jgi:3-isopropylmalate dehydrogenase